MRGLTHKNARQGGLPAERAQDNTRDLIRQLQACPFLNGRLVRVSFTAATPKVVSHRVGSRASFLVLRAKVTGTVYPRFTEGADQTLIDVANQLRITSDTTCVADLWFFERPKETTPE